MSIVIALKVKNGDMVLTADRLAIDGELQGDSQPDEDYTKVLKFNSGAIGIVNYVGAAIHPLEKAIETIEKNNDKDPIDIISKTMRDFYTENLQAEKPDIKLVCAYSYKGINKIRAMESPNFVIHKIGESHTILGQRDYAMKLRKLFWYDDIEINEATELAVFLVMNTGKIDIKVGTGVPDVIKVINGKAEIVDPSDVERIAKAAKVRIDTFANVFRKPATPTT